MGASASHNHRCLHDLLQDYFLRKTVELVRDKHWKENCSITEDVNGYKKGRRHKLTRYLKMDDVNKTKGLIKKLHTL
jgi:hypothetical protein